LPNNSLLLKMKNLLLLLSVFIIFETSGQSNQQSIYARRNNLLHQADSLMMKGEDNTPAYINILKKIAATDADTFLVAANAYGKIKFAFSMTGDSTFEKIAAETELYYINKSLSKYPYNFDGYPYRLMLYKYASNKDGEEALIKTFQQNFSGSWKMNVTMAHHYIKYDFLWPDSKEFDLCSSYLKKAVELNPEDFNSLLLLSVAYENNKEARILYLKKMRALAPQQFVRNPDENKSKFPFVVKSIALYPLLRKDLTVVLSSAECTLLNLK